MHRTIRSLVLAVVLMIPAAAASPVAATQAASGHTCTKGDVQSLASATIAIGKQRLRGGELGSAGAWSCQFRLYDGNDDENNPDNPEVPNVFKTSDWFLGGIFEWLTRDEMTYLGFDRPEAVAYMNSIEDHMFWRKQGGNWTELPLIQTSIRSVLHPSGDVLAVERHRYHVFPEGSLAPGVYEWRWENFDPFFDPPDFTAYGEVHIVN